MNFALSIQLYLRLLLIFCLNYKIIVIPWNDYHLFISSSNRPWKELNKKNNQIGGERNKSFFKIPETTRTTQVCC